MRDMFSEAEIRSWRDFVLAKFGDWFPLAFHFGAPFAFAGLAGEGGAVRTLEALGAAAMLAQDEVSAALGVWHLAVVTAQRVVLCCKAVAGKDEADDIYTVGTVAS